MPSKQDHADSFARRLPSGEAWPDNTDGTWEYDALIRALSSEPAEVDTDILELAENFFPDTSVDFLPDWERLLDLSKGSLSDAERQAQILAALRRSTSRADRASIESVLRARRGDDTLCVLHKLFSCFRAGDGAGGACWGPQGEATYVCEYMADVLAADPADFESWTSASFVFVNGAVNGPRSGIAGAATAVCGSFFGTHTLSAEIAAANGVQVYASIWVRSLYAQTITAGILQRDGATVTDEQTITAGTTWVKLTFRGTAGTGADNPLLCLSVTGAADLELDYAVAGIRDASFEAYAATLPHLGTTGEFAVIQEYG